MVKFSGELRGGDELHAELLGALGQVAQHPLTVALLEVVLPLVGVFLALGTPRPDNSPGFFAGEWAGTGERGSYCYLHLGSDSREGELVDGGTDDWLGAQMHWRNRQQTLQVEKVTPLPVSTRRRVMPLETFVLRSGFNQSLSLTWNTQSSGCQLQKIETTARHLDRARKAMEELLQGESKR